MPDDGLSRSALDRGAFSSVTPFAKELKVAFGVGPAPPPAQAMQARKEP